MRGLWPGGRSGVGGVGGTSNQQTDLFSSLVSMLVLFFSALPVHVAFDPRSLHQIDFLVAWRKVGHLAELNGNLGCPNFFLLSHISPIVFSSLCSQGWP